jgi:dolichol-phosphate mannosyltransferase
MTDTWPPGAVWVVIPTYNEAGNIERLLRVLTAQLDRAGIDGHLLVVDDGSPDGTAGLVRQVAAGEPRIHLLERPVKQGIGPAYIAGFRQALAGGAELVVQMDADFSHDPADVPRLVDAARDADVVIGSRYVSGGKVVHWGPLRRVISRAGSIYARAILGLRIRDLTAGFKCFRGRVLQTLALDEVGAAGYVFQIEMTYRAILAGFRVVEVPVTFTERQVGASKMTGGIVREAATRVPRLRRLARGARPSC